MTRILCVGIAVVDFIFRYDAVPSTPGKHIAKGFEPVVGGMATNAAIAVSRLGGTGALMSRVGADPNGRFTLEEIITHGVGPYRRYCPGWCGDNHASTQADSEGRTLDLADRVSGSSILNPGQANRDG